MKNKTSIFLCWLFGLPFRIVFNLFGVLILVLTAFFFGIIGKR